MNEDAALIAARATLSPELLPAAPERIKESEYRESRVAQPRRHTYSVLKIAPTSFFADYGAHVRILEEAMALQQSGNQVTICTYPTGRNIDGIRIKRAAGIPGRRQIRVGSYIDKYYLDLLLMARATATAWHHRPDILHAHVHEGTLIANAVRHARLSRIPLIFDFQGSLTAEMVDHNFLKVDSHLHYWFRKLEHRICHMADAIITSSGNGAMLLHRDFGVPLERIYPLPDYVDCERFKPRWEMPCEVRECVRAQLGIPAGSKVIVYLGLLAEYQGIGHLLQAYRLICEKHRDAHLLLMGYPGQERYREQAAGLGILDRVTFTGKVEYAKAPLYLSLGDIAVSAKMSLTESNGKLLNYMALGLPTVAYDTNVARELLGDEGIRVPVGDIEGLAAQLDWLLSDTYAAEQIGRALRRRTEQEFSWCRFSERLLDIYDTISR